MLTFNDFGSKASSLDCHLDHLRKRFGLMKNPLAYLGHRYNCKISGFGFFLLRGGGKRQEEVF